MASIQSVIARMEGMIGTMPTTTFSSQRLSTWVEACKAVMRSDGLRDKTDWDFSVADPVIKTISSTSGVIYAGACTVYGALLEQDSADAEEDFIVFDDDADQSATFDGTAALANTVKFAFRPAAAGTDGTNEYHAFVFPTGLKFASYGCVASDGVDGTDTASGDIRGFFLYRTSASE